jgi:hypothetical protein
MSHPRPLVLVRLNGTGGGVKQLKTDKISHLSMDSVEKQDVIFGDASMEESSVTQQAAGKYDASAIDDFVDKQHCEV